MQFKCSSIIFLLLSLYCEIGKTAETSKTPAPRPAVRACQDIIKNYQASMGNYIIGGKLAVPGEFPHMVALGYNRDLGLEFDCGGAIISNNYILTAAHCIRSARAPLSPYMIRAGVVNVTSKDFNPKTDTNVSEIIYHPKYFPRRKYHDLALIKLATPLKFTPNINSICLETNNYDPKVPLTITGFGKTDYYDNENSNILKKAQIKVTSRDKCTELYKNTPSLPDGITEYQLCAGDPEGRQDTCQGDSGGPLIIPEKEGRSRLVGVTSFGRACGTLIPGVYIRVSRYLDWLESIVWPK